MNFQAANETYLVGGLSGVPSGHLTSHDKFRRYRANLNVGVYEHGSYTYKRLPIYYEVGYRHPTKGKTLATDYGSDTQYAVDASVSMNAVEAANFEGWAKKYSNFAPVWQRMDLAAIIERLGRAVCAQSLFGSVSTKDIRGGSLPRVTALGSLDSPVTASLESVFIPRLVDNVDSVNVFSVLAAAANGAGARVVTDVLRIDAGTNQPLVPEVEGFTMARAAVEALRILGANYEAAGAGDVFSYALTRGIHSSVSVVGHTDEGGWLRDVFRAGSFRVPYGGIDQSKNSYPALPPLVAASVDAVSGWVDTLALKTAALVAHCDPCTLTDKGYYPSVYSSNASQGKGVNGDGTPADAGVIGRLISADIGRFINLYVPALTKLYGLTGDTGVAHVHFSTVATHALTGSEDRHLQYQTVAPYYWIEPTSLIPKNFAGSPAESAGFASLVTAGETATQPCFEKTREMDKGRHSDFVALAFKMRTARTSGLVSAYASQPSKLAGMRMYQFDPKSIALPGSGQTQTLTLHQRHEQSSGLSEFLWKRGQSPLPAPGELINLAGTYGAKYHVVNWDDDFNPTNTDLPEAWELDQHPVEWRVSTPTAIAVGKANSPERSAQRTRTAAAISLSHTTARVRGLGEALSPVMESSTIPPNIDDEPAAAPVRDSLLRGSEHSGSAHSYGVGAPHIADGETSVAKGVDLMPTVHHGSLRGPSLPPASQRGQAPQNPPDQPERPSHTADNNEEHNGTMVSSPHPPTI